MIKGHSYDKQIYQSVADRLINNTFLNESNGIFKNEGKACKVTFSRNTITISDGFFVIQGGLTEIEDTETLTAVLNNSYCVLVYEIDMSQTNTELEFIQGRFRILTGTNTYPNLTKQKLTKNSGIYQYEFARFVASSTGITNFQDTRTFLDYKSIFEFIKKEINQIEDGSLYVTQNQFNTIKSEVDELNSNPTIVISNEQPVPEKGKTIVWLKPKN